jgi:glycosyltransferase involved in cell wall biosynthesis
MTKGIQDSSIQVSVIIPAYNRARLLVAAVDSVLSQGVGNIEIIVVDDGSSDHPEAALAPFGDKVRLLRKVNGGVSSARNMGLAAAKGQYIAYLKSGGDIRMPSIRLFPGAQYADVAVGSTGIGGGLG